MNKFSHSEYRNAELNKMLMRFKEKMGIYIGRNRTCSSCEDRVRKEFNDPDPTNFKITKFYEYNGFIIVKLNYPNCKNFEGNKILVYKCPVTIYDIINAKSIDPHFSDKNKPAPFARFEPTELGWDAAVAMITKISLPMEKK